MGSILDIEKHRNTVGTIKEFLANNPRCNWGKYLQSLKDSDALYAYKMEADRVLLRPVRSAECIVLKCVKEKRELQAELNKRAFDTSVCEIAVAENKELRAKVAKLQGKFDAQLDYLRPIFSPTETETQVRIIAEEALEDSYET